MATKTTINLSRKSLKLIQVQTQVNVIAFYRGQPLPLHRFKTNNWGNYTN